MPQAPSMVLGRVEARRAWRRFPPARAVRILAAVASHPSNEGHRAGALVRSMKWQVLSRLRAAPIEVPAYGQLRLVCYPRSQSGSNVIYFTPYYDVDEMRFLHRYLRAGDSVIDAGANIGTYTLLAASRVGPGGLVRAFEPAPTALARLRENVLLNELGQVEVHGSAVGARPGRLPMLSSSDVSNTLVPASAKNPRHVDVEVVRMDDVVSDRPPHLMKIDVEGYELEALRGAERVLTSDPSPVVLIEFVGHLLGLAGTSPAEVRAWLEERGYALFRYRAATGDLRSIKQQATLHGNYLAINRDNVDEVASRVALH